MTPQPMDTVKTTLEKIAAEVEFLGAARDGKRDDGRYGFYVKVTTDDIIAIRAAISALEARPAEEMAGVIRRLLVESRELMAHEFGEWHELVTNIDAALTPPPEPHSYEPGEPR